MSACDTPIGSPLAVSVDCTSGQWQDSGITLVAGQCLQITAMATTVKFGVNSDQCAYPEGYYSSAPNPCMAPTYDPSVVNATYGGDPPNPYITLLLPAYCLLAAIGSKPSGTHLTGLLRPNRSTMYQASTVGAGGKVWLNFNDNIFVDNTGSFSVTVQAFSTSPAPPPVVSFRGGNASGIKWGVQSEEAFQGLTVSFPGGYLQGFDIAASVPGFRNLITSRVRVRGPYRAFLVGTILHVVNDSGELASGTALDGVDILRIGT